MPDITRSVEIVFGAIDDTTSGVNSAIQNLDGINSSVQRASQPLADMFDTVFRIQGGFIALGAAAGTWAVTTAADVSDAFREITTLVNAPLSDLEAFRAEVLSTAATSSSTFADFEGAIYSAISAGVDYTDSVEFTTQAEQLAIAGKAGLQESLVVLVSALNAYGRGAEDADYFSDLLFTTVQQGQTTLPELASSLARVTAIAANAGVDFDQLLAALAALTSVGFGTAESVTGLRAVINSVLRPTAQVQEAAQALGLQFDLAALQSQGLAGFMESVGRATAGNQQALISLFPSVEALGPALALTGLAAETFARNLEGMQDSAGATEEAYSRMVDGFALGNQRVINSFRGLLVTVGDPLLDEMTQIQNAFISIFQTIARSFQDGALESVGDAFEGIAQSIAAFLTEFATNLPEALSRVDFTPALEAFGGFTDAVGGLFGDFDFSSVEGIERAIEIAVQAFVRFQEVATAQVEGIVPFIQRLQLLAGIFLDSSSNITQTVGEVLAFGREVNIITGMLAPLFDILGGVTGLLSQIVLLNVASRFGLIPPVVAGATSAFSGLLGVLAGPVGIVALAAGAGFSVGTAANALLEFNGISIGSSLYDLRQWFHDILNPTEVAARNFATLEERQRAAAIETARLADAAAQAVLMGGNWSESIAQTNREYEEFNIQQRLAADGTPITVREFEALAFASQQMGTAVTDINVAMGLYNEELARREAAQQAVLDLTAAQTDADSQRVQAINAENDRLEAMGETYRVLAGENSNFQRVSVETYNRIGRASGEVIRSLDGIGLTEAQLIRANELYGESWELVDGLVTRIIPGIGRSVTAADTVTDGWIRTVGEDGVEAFQQVGLVAPEEIQRAVDALNEAEQAALDFQVSMEEIASNERIQFFQASFELDIAEVEANMEIVTALLDSVGTIFESTMGGINQIFSMTENPEWDRFGFEARRQLDLYNAILQEQVDIQRGIAEAQIAYMNARTQAITRGSALLQVDGAGLQPHLEAFMWEILRAIQIRVNEDGLEMLLGAPA